MKFFWGKLTSRLVVCIFCASSQYLNAGSNNLSQYNFCYTFNFSFFWRAFLAFVFRMCLFRSKRVLFRLFLHVFNPAEYSRRLGRI